MTRKIPQPTILLVDDEHNILASLSRLLRPLKYNILCAQTGAEGLSIVEQNNVDLVLADMRMPKMDGITFLEQVSTLCPHTVRVLITGSSNHASTIDAINRGHIFKYISKPWDDDELLVVVRQSLEYKRLRDEREELLALTQTQNEQLRDLNSELDERIRERDRLAAILDKELEMARTVQESLLPLANNPGLPLAGFNVPARQLSGDFYDFFSLANGKIYFNLGDVSGKGANAALLMVKTCSLFRCLARESLDPGELLYRINQELCDSRLTGMFVTMAAGLYEPTSGQLLIVNAGHVPPVIIQKDGQIQMIGAGAPPLGISPEQAFPVTELSIREESLYLFSDGLTERNVNGKMIMDMDLVVSMLKEFRHLPREERLKVIVEQLMKDAIPSHDDMTIVLLENRH
jgi:serine phosphatase RsbU (regulator of sigma subunit)